MEKLDISLLFKNPIKDKEVILTIEPLAPLSMVNTIPGSYYKTQKAPTKFNISGVFENVLGWHLSDNTLSKFFKENQLKFPQYYTSPTSREFIIVDGEYKLKMRIKD